MNGKGDRNRSFTQAYRDGWDRIFGIPDVPTNVVEVCEDTIAYYERLREVYDRLDADFIGKVGIIK